MADSAESTLSPPLSGNPPKPQRRRASTVSTDTENKLARAARSAQRLAQLSDAARDGTTLDLFPDDTARAEQQALNTDVRQGTLQGFELPDVVLAAAGAPAGVGFATTARSVRGGVAKGDAVAHDGQLSIDTDACEPAPGTAVDTPTQSASLTASSVARNSAAVPLTREIADTSELVSASDEDVASEGAASDAGVDDTEPASTIAQSTSIKPQPTHATPELDHARATAFADTVDALYGVIADQRRAASDHSRCMKWLLSIVVCALLASIAIGITQTLLLFRLAHQSTAHEMRIEQMLLNQQATLATLLDTDSSTVSLPVSAQPAAPAAAAPVTQHAPTRHASQRKLAHTH